MLTLLLQIVILLIILGLLLYGVDQLPFEPPVVKLIRAVVVIVAVLVVVYWLVGVAGGPPLVLRRP